MLTDEELAATNQGVILDDALSDRLTAWIEKHYPDELSANDLLDPKLARSLTDALDELTQILDLPGLYPFQR